MKINILGCFYLVCALLALTACGNNKPPGEISSSAYSVSPVVNVPMRDGVHLRTVIVTPPHQEPLPIILMRTPYGVDEDGDLSRLSTLAAEGYIFVFQDIRGRNGSEGLYRVLTQWRDPSDPKSVDETTDAYDTIDWLIKNVPLNNGKVGMMGGSYDGLLTLMASLEPHPALAAVSPQAPPIDWFRNDDFHRNGAFRLSYAFDYGYMMDSQSSGLPVFPYPEADTYPWFLKLGLVSEVNESHFHGKFASWNMFVEHPDYDSYWKSVSMIPHIDSPKVPTLLVGGWWDQEDPWGPQETFRIFQKNDPHHLSHLVEGPWFHEAWMLQKTHPLLEVTRKLGFGPEIVGYYKEKIEAPFFAYYLKGKGTADIPAVISYETGSNIWRQYHAWPPRETIRTRFYLYKDTLSQTKPDEPQALCGEYDSDPKNPVPYRSQPIEATYLGRKSRWYTWEFENQRLVDERPDVLKFHSDELTQDLRVVGDFSATISASSSGSDSDWIVKVIDEYPADAQTPMGGYRLMISNEIVRARYRSSLETPSPLTPGKVEQYSIPLRMHNHVFKTGHRILVEIQSTWFPLIDINPQTFVPSIYAAMASDFKMAHQSVFCGNKFGSYIEFSAWNRGQ